MVKKPDSKTEAETLKELAENNMLQIEAILRIVTKKNIITKAEYLEEMQQIVQELRAKGKTSN